MTAAMSTGWDDHETAAYNAALEYILLLEEETGRQPDMHETTGAFQADAYYFSSLSPDSLEQEFDYTKSIAESLKIGEGDDGELYDLLWSIETGLEGWHGTAAEAFRLHVSRIRAFINKSSNHIVDALKGPVALYTLAVRSRQSYSDLIKAFHEQCSSARDSGGSLSDVTTFVVDLTADALKVFAGGAKLTLDTLGSFVVDQFIDGAADGAKASLDGGVAEDIFASYRANYKRIKTSYERSLQEISHEMHRGVDRLNEWQPRIFEPLPVNTDITGPNFRYENFSNSDRGGAAWEAQLDDERAKYKKKHKKASGLAEANNPIQRALEGP